jgi:hypothetical protein
LREKEAAVSWSRRFDEPIVLPDGRKLRTPIAWLAKEIPKSAFFTAEPESPRKW